MEIGQFRKNSPSSQGFEAFSKATQRVTKWVTGVTK